MTLVDAAAWAGLMGVCTATEFLAVDDDFELSVRVRLIERAVALDQERARSWAAHIANGVGQLFR
jgi:hypothetical protein